LLRRRSAGVKLMKDWIGVLDERPTLAPNKVTVQEIKARYAVLRRLGRISLPFCPWRDSTRMCGVTQMSRR
jgi:hypothetical protein